VWKKREENDDVAQMWRELVQQIFNWLYFIFFFVIAIDHYYIGTCRPSSLISAGQLLCLYNI
jgi:hypothetical protein